DEGGDGAPVYEPMRLEAQAPDAIAMPGMVGAGETPPINGYCFYEVNSSVTGGGPLPQAQPVDPQLGVLNAPVRELFPTDVLAVPFDMTGPFYDNCPNTVNLNGIPVEFVDGGGGTVATTTVTLLGARNQAGLNDPIPATGISDPDGILNGNAYNFDAVPGDPARTILLAELVSFDAVPDVAPPSTWWFDNLHLTLREGAPPCVADIFGNDGVVNAADLAALLGAWGPGGGNGPADLNMDGVVNASDLGQLLGSWGPCPMDAQCP
ncbi:MAG: hypothetical protein VYC34_03405, partial [Planctomycetota bacterium]|nr:hypothetical protein [Planctomycetota bacterium]